MQRNGMNESASAEHRGSTPPAVPAEGIRELVDACFPSRYIVANQAAITGVCRSG